MGKRVLITGGAGFIGSHVGERFLADGWAVDVIDDFSTGKRENLPADAALHVLDIRSPDAAALVRREPFDAIVHLAAQMDVRRSVADPMFDASTNVLGTLNLLEALRGSGRGARCRFAFASTGGALYGDGVTPPNREIFAKDPDSPYGISKLSVEHYLSYYARLHGLDTVAMRFANVYGPRQDPHGEAGVVAIFCGRILAQRPLTIFGDGLQTRDYVYVGDVADAVFASVTRSLPGPGGVDARAFNIGTGVPTTVVTLAQTLLEVARSNVPAEHAPPRTGEQMHSFLDVTKAGHVLGWEPRVPLAEGLARTFAWFMSRSGSAVAS